MTKKLSSEFSRPENQTLGALARVNDFLMNPLIQGHSGTTPETSRNAFNTTQGTNEDNSQSDPHPESGMFQKQMTRNSGPEEGQDMVKGVTEEIRNRHDSVTGVHEEVTYCSPSTTSKSRKIRSTSQPQLYCEKRLRQWKQTNFCWTSSSWQTTTILQTSILLLTEFPNCQSRSRLRYPCSTGNLRRSSCLKIFSK